MNTHRFFLAFIFAASSTWALAASGDAPTGFRGLDWGARPTKALKKDRDPTNDSKVSVWTLRRKPPAPYLGVPVANEAYLFENGKLCGGQLGLEGTGNFEKIKAALIEEIGEPDFKNENLGIFRWRWRTEYIDLSLAYRKWDEISLVNFTKGEFFGRCR